MFLKPTPLESSTTLMHTFCKVYRSYRKWNLVEQVSCVEMLEFSGFLLTFIFLQDCLLEIPSFIFTDVSYDFLVPGSVTQSLV